jgi:hypothetical protein
MERSSDILTHTLCPPNFLPSKHFALVTFHTLYATRRIVCPPLIQGGHIVTCDLMSTLFSLDCDIMVHLNFHDPYNMPQDFTPSAVIWGRQELQVHSFFYVNFNILSNILLCKLMRVVS